MAEYIDMVLKMDSFRPIPKDYLGDLLQRCEIMKIPKGKFLYKIDDPVTAIFVVLAGQFCSYRLTAEGKQCTVKTMFKGEFIGEEDIFANEFRDKIAESIIDSQCLSIPKKEYEKLLEAYPRFSRMRLEKLFNRLRETEQTMQAIAYSKVKERLMLILSNIGKEIGVVKGNEIEFVLNWSHEDLASMIGSTRETITNTFSLLQSEGILTINRKKIFLNKEKLDQCF